MSEQPPKTSFRSLEAFKPGVKATALDWNADGRRLACGGSDGSIAVWSFSSGNPRKIWDPRMKGQVEQIKWSPHHIDTFVACSAEEVISNYDARVGKTIGSIQLNSRSICCAYSTDGSNLAVVTKDNVVQIYDIKTLSPKAQIPAQTAEINDICFTPEGDLLLMATSDGTVIATRWPELTNPVSIRASSTPIYAIDYDPFGRYVAVGCGDALCNLLDADDLSCTKSIGACEGSIRALSFSYNGDYIALASEDPNPSICNVETGALMHTVSTGFKSMNTLKWNPTQNQLVCAGAHESIRLIAIN